MTNLILYNYFRSSTSFRTRIALHYKKLSYEYRPIHLLKDGGEQHKPEYRQLNPTGEVPTLIHNGKVLAQSFAIIEYLDEVFPSPPILPTEPYQRAKVRQFCENINSFLHPLSNLKVLQYLEKHNGYDQKQKELWISHWYHQGLSANEKLLTETAGTYCFGEQITAADMFLIPLLFTAQRFNVDLSPYPLSRRINQTCESVDCFAKAHPFRQIDTPDEFKIK